MCIICLEFQRSKDLVDAERMLAAARREPSSIPPEHLDVVQKELDEASAKAQGQTPP